MKQAPFILLTVLMMTPVAPAAAEDIILRLRPETAAPIITRITATENVLRDAAPVDENREWMQLNLKVPFEGYVPAATLTKNFAIVDNTPVLSRPDPKTDVITRARDGDLYEVLRVSNEWATVRINKKLSAFFPARAAPSSTPVPEAPALDLTVSAPMHTPGPDAVGFDPDRPIAQTAPEDLPPENVVWKSAPRSPAPNRWPQPQAADTQPVPPELPGGIMVGPAETQASEAASHRAPEPDQPIRLLTGILVREIEPEGPAYPIRLRSAEGRLIAYVDFSGLFIKDLNSYLDQRVHLRGQIIPVQSNDRDLVIFVRKIQFAD